MTENSPPRDIVDVVRQLAAALEVRHVEYALGGAFALGFWAAPRGTLDVDITLYLAPDRPGECIWTLQEIGCTLSAQEASRFLTEHGFCRATCGEFRVDVFLPITPFYEAARQRRRRVDLDGQEVMIWDAETLAVFKMMFFRDKDTVDTQQILRTQGKSFDRIWVGEQLKSIFGRRDPRVIRWDELVQQIAE